mgnify:CR=1 FL=1
MQFIKELARLNTTPSCLNTNINGIIKATNLAEKLKKTGFAFATQAGISISIEDLKVPPTKDTLFAKNNTQINLAYFYEKRGNINEIERFQKVIDIWNNANNYLKEEEDLKQTRECIKVARKILSQPALSEHAGEEVGPGLDSQSDDELNEYIRSKADTAYHPCGTCKMGVDDMSVVDQDLKVKGIENLRVIDASIIPEIPSANLNAPTLMIAEKGSDYILNS